MRNLKFWLVLAFALVSCSVYDNYDGSLMPDAVASIEDDSSSSVKETPVSSSEEKSSSSQPEEKSSSSETVSSSSETPKSSSSSSAAWTCDSILDYGKYQYKVAYVEEKGLCFTAENMRKTVLEMAGKTMCYDSLEENCEKYGLLYNHDAALHVCPQGWHLPSWAEYDTLRHYTGVDLEYESGEFFKATAGWKADAEDDEEGYNGNDYFGFAALPSGYCRSTGKCYGLGTTGEWWTSSLESVYSKTYKSLELFGSDQTSGYSTELPDVFYAVRCFKDKN
jgi:uncharacterized protein (TIGR02145 family)